ncbi:MAG: cyclic di-GMP phosphodiesterase [Fusobacteriaceae bacterium]|jgi:putative two-component system response regulator|nr:cyclic di-GMP phosphodiesterase [Fusobacteriaceae bacterium]
MNRYTILIVDDTPENLDVLAGILNDDYDIKVAKNGKIALKIAEKFLPDLILLDIMMPEMDGYEVCKKLKNNIKTKNIPVIFVTAKDQEVDEKLGFEAGAVDYLTKPIRPTITKARIKTHLKLANQTKALAIEVDKKTKEIQNTQLEIIRKLGLAAEYKDNETGAHIIRMSTYSKLLALEYGIPEYEANLLFNAAPMHDIGKIGIPDSILQKPGKLNDEEWNIMKTHANIGAKIIGEHPSELLKMAKIVALEHHEKYNGKGYPRGLKGEEISIYASIVAIADVFDALTSKRPYKEPWSDEKALNLIKEERGEHFHPKLVDCFINIFDKVLEVKSKFQD